MIRWTALLLLVACSGEPAAPEQPNTPPPEATPPADVRFDVKDLQAQASQEALVPSPAEVQRTLQNAGLTSKLAELVKGRKVVVEGANDDEVAVRTGIVLAQLVLSAASAPKEDLTAHVAQLKTGLGKLGAGEDIQKSLDDLSARIANEASSREDLVREMDEIAGMMVPDVEFKVGERALPLIRAGAWLEGAWLVTSAIQAEGKYEAATSLVRQPAVVAYFRSYLSKEGQSVAQGELMTQLDQTLTTLEGVTAKETISQEDVAAVHDAVGAVLTKAGVGQ